VLNGQDVVVLLKLAGQDRDWTVRSLEAELGIPLREEIARVRRQGYAIVDEELEAGLRSVAVPIDDAAGKVTAAVQSLGSGIPHVRCRPATAAAAALARSGCRNRARPRRERRASPVVRLGTALAVVTEQPVLVSTGRRGCRA